MERGSVSSALYDLPGPRARAASPGTSVTATPAARSCSAPSPSVNSRGSRQAKTTRGMPTATMCCTQVSGREARAPQGTSEL